MPGSLSNVADRLATLPRDGVLTEPEGLEILEALGVPVPIHRVFRIDETLDPGWLEALPGDRAVLKIVSRTITHKSDVGGVLVVPRRAEDVHAAMETLRRRFDGADGLLIEEFIPHEQGPGSELLLGFRWTDDFGPVVSVSAGGLYAEFLSGLAGPGGGTALLSPEIAPADLAASLLKSTPAVAAATGKLRGQKAQAPLEDLAGIVARFLEFAARFCGRPFVDFEVNPLAAAGGRWVALDALGHVASAGRARSAPRPLRKVARLLTPRSVAVIGVSEKMNPGRIIVRNLLREGFDPEKITVIKPGIGEIDGCRCVPDIAALAEPVDLCVLAIAAHQVPETVEEIVRAQKAESLIVIPGGLEEKAGTAPLVERLRKAVADSRATAWEGPVVCGGNSLGVRSLPGRIDTLFIPREKLPFSGPESPLALVSNSGAFAVARASRFTGLNPRYVITAGNQMDLTIGDYVSFLAGDPEVKVFAVYVEGFRPLDGLAFVKAAREITAGGRTVVLYRAGRTPAGRSASASHTAAIAGDYAVTRALAREAGVLVAETLEEFEDLVRLAVRLDGRPVRESRLGAITNAGFECVAMADNLGPFTPAVFSDRTRAALRELLEKARVGSIVDVHNPLDLTPMTPDAPYEEAVRLVFEDENVDLAIVSCVPLTAALRTGPNEIDEVGGIAARLIRLHASSTKPWVAVVDAGPLFDPLARKLDESGVPVFRTVDRALQALAQFRRS